ncbi:MAG: response regulator [Verrucomicrobiota bacterium]
MPRPVSALIVDDEKHIRLYLKLVLKQIGFEKFFEAADGQEAIEEYKHKRPELVLMDVNMPVKEGLDALKEIVEFDPEAIVVMASSVASRKAVESSVEAGASYYIRKDTPKDEIAKILSHVIDDIWGGSTE